MMHRNVVKFQINMTMDDSYWNNFELDQVPNREPKISFYHLTNHIHCPKSQQQIVDMIIDCIYSIQLYVTRHH